MAEVRVQEVGFLLLSKERFLHGRSLLKTNPCGEVFLHVIGGRFVGLDFVKVWMVGRKEEFRLANSAVAEKVDECFDDVRLGTEPDNNFTQSVGRNVQKVV